MKADRRILVLWALAMGLITYREIKAPAPDAIVPGIPRPWAYTGGTVAYVVAALVGEASASLGAALALAWTVAIYLGYFGAPGPAGGGSGSARAAEGVKVP
jgi:hypothetical protein